jgi:hypothetical protein
LLAINDSAMNAIFRDNYLKFRRDYSGNSGVGQTIFGGEVMPLKQAINAERFQELKNDFCATGVSNAQMGQPPKHENLLKNQEVPKIKNEWRRRESNPARAIFQRNTERRQIYYTLMQNPDK